MINKKIHTQWGRN